MPDPAAVPADPSAEVAPPPPVLAVPPASGTQTLWRGLAVLECVAQGIGDLRGISQRLGTARSTTHRLLASLVQQRYLHHLPAQGYVLGPRLLWLGQRAQEQRPLVALARPELQALARQTGDTVHLGVIDDGQVLYLDKVGPGQGLEMRSRIGQRMPLATTGIGRALMLGLSPDRWEALYQRAAGRHDALPDKPALPAWPDWSAAMERYAEQDWVMDLEENERGIRCVAAPVRELGGRVVAAISVAGAVPYMDAVRMQALGPQVRARARTVSRLLGWQDGSQTPVAGEP